MTIVALCDPLVPQLLIAFTKIVPPVVLDNAVIVLVVELPVQPDGRLHL